MGRSKYERELILDTVEDVATELGYDRRALERVRDEASRVGDKLDQVPDADKPLVRDIAEAVTRYVCDVLHVLGEEELSAVAVRGVANFLVGLIKVNPELWEDYLRNKAPQSVAGRSFAMRPFTERKTRRWNTIKVHCRFRW